jgi:23S rRNA-/tRNA-specific pseudouridylate synthase
MAGGRTALTEFRLLSTTGDFSLVEARPHTGRTHQIRVHLEASGLAIVGDTTYGGAPATRMMLHCSSLGFKDERGRELHVTAPLDTAFEAVLGGCGQVIPSCHGTEDTRLP